MIEAIQEILSLCSLRVRGMLSSCEAKLQGIMEGVCESLQKIAAHVFGGRLRPVYMATDWFAPCKDRESEPDPFSMATN